MITLFNIRPKGHNIGNEAISVGLKGMLYEHFGRLVNIISIPATDKYDAGSHFGLSAPAVHLINRTGDGVIVGGGNLLENNELVFDEQSLASLRPPLALFSVSRGRVYDRHFELAERTDVMPDAKLRMLCERADVALVRDQSTFDHLRNMGVDDVELGGCPTVSMGDYSKDVYPLPVGENVGALISIRNPQLMNIPIRLQSDMPVMTKQLVELLRQRGMSRVRLLVHDPRDVEYAMSFRGVDAVYTSDVWEYLALLRASELCVSFRLHASIPALSMGRPVVNLSYDERSLSLMRTIGFGDWDLDIVQEPDPVAAVSERMDRLGELSAMVDAARSGRWAGTVDVMNRGIADFADRVKRYARQPARR